MCGRSLLPHVVDVELTTGLIGIASRCRISKRTCSAIITYTATTGSAQTFCFYMLNLYRRSNIIFFIHNFFLFSVFKFIDIICLLQNFLATYNVQALRQSLKVGAYILTVNIVNLNVLLCIGSNTVDACCIAEAEVEGSG